MEISGQSLSSKGLASHRRKLAEDSVVGIPDSGRMTGYPEVGAGRATIPRITPVTPP